METRYFIDIDLSCGVQMETDYYTSIQDAIDEAKEIIAEYDSSVEYSCMLYTEKNGELEFIGIEI